MGRRQKRLPFALGAAIRNPFTRDLLRHCVLAQRPVSLDELAASLGNLSLMLRRAGEQVMDATRRVTTSDLSQTETMQQAPEAKRFAKVSVTRGTTKQDYNVASEETEGRTSAEEQAAVRR